MRAISTLLILCLAASLAACGGGGDERRIPPPPTAASLFAGAYHVVGWAGNYGPHVDLCHWGTSTADGIDSFTVDLERNADGVLSALPTFGPYAYTASSDRSLEWDLGGGSLARGGLSSTGDVLGVGAFTTGDAPEILLLSREATTLSTASLDGFYHVAGIYHDPTGSEHASFWGTIEFDSIGGGTFEGFINTEGVIAAAMATPVTYGLASDGSLDFTLGTVSLQGAVLEGGDLGLVAGGTGVGDPPTLLAFVRQSTGATGALLSGSYFLVGCEHDRAGQIGSHRSLSGAAQADGAGGITPTYSQNTEGAMVSTSPIWTGYSVAADGTLTMTTAGGETFEGGVSPTGEFAVLAGGTLAAEDQRVFLLFR